MRRIRWPAMMGMLLLLPACVDSNPAPFENPPPLVYAAPDAPAAPEPPAYSAYPVPLPPAGIHVPPTALPGPTLYLEEKLREERRREELSREARRHEQERRWAELREAEQRQREQRPTIPVLPPRRSDCDPNRRNRCD